MAKQPAGKVASMNPDNMADGGLADDFDATIIEARVTTFDYNGTKAPSLSVRLTFDMADKSEYPEPYVQHYSAGSLDYFVPSMDGEEPSAQKDDGNYEDGIYALQAGDKEMLSKSTNWAQFLYALRDGGYKGELAADVRFVEGIFGHFNRIPQKKRSGIVVDTPADGGVAKTKTVLVLTELKTAPKAAKAGAKAAAPAPKAAAGKAAPKASAGGDDEALAELVMNAVLEAEDNSVERNALSKLVLKSAAFPAAKKGAAVKRITDPEFLSSSELFAYDEDSDTVGLPE